MSQIAACGIWLQIWLAAVAMSVSHLYVIYIETSISVYTFEYSSVSSRIIPEAHVWQKLSQVS